MRLPFTTEEFFAVFGRYNETVWPLQILFVIAAISAAILVWRRPQQFSKPVLFVVGLLWLWMGVVYHWGFFRSANPAAAGFAVLFVIEAIIVIGYAATGRIQLRPGPDAAGITGIALVVYALLLYPAIGYILGHRYPLNPTFGLPCPTTIYTVGILLWGRHLSLAPFVIPVIWCVIGATAAMSLGVYEDAALLLAALASVILVLRHRRAERRQSIGPHPAAA